MRVKTRGAYNVSRRTERSLDNVSGVHIYMIVRL